MFNRQTLKRRILPIAFGVGLVAISLVFQQSANPLIKSLRNRMDWIAYDVRLQQTLPKKVEKNSDIVIIDVDDKSLKEIGRWPWPRATIAKLIDKLSDYGVIISAFDIVFAEPEMNVATELASQLAKHKDKYQGVDDRFISEVKNLAPNFDGDLMLSRTLAEKEVVLGYAFRPNSTLRSGDPGKPLAIKNKIDLTKTIIPVATGFAANLTKLQKAAHGSGFFNATPDNDGIIRRSQLLYRYNGKLYPALSLEVAREYLFADKLELDTSEIDTTQSLEYISFNKELKIPTNGQGEVIIPYRGGPYSFNYISAADVLAGRTPREQLEAKIAFVGTSAIGLGDIKPTPVGTNYPGVEVHASILAGILANSFPSEPQWAQGANFIVTLLLGLMLASLLPFASPVNTVIFTLLSAAGLIYGNVWFWTEKQFVLTLATPLLMIALLAAANLAYGYLFESQGKKQLKEQFGSYVPPQLVDQMMKSSEGFGFEGERREMTVLFADIRSFTSISEKLSATELKDMLNRFFTPMTEIIFNKHGTIDKYVGDMIMAFWGAPVKDPEHARHAIDAALTMLEKVEEIKPQLMQDGYPEINIGVGLNTGFMNVGNMGSEFRRAYTVLGDAVNLASRLEGLTKFYGVKLIVGENTRENQEDYVFRKLDVVQVKGKKEPVTIYEPVCRINAITDTIKEELDRFHTALQYYHDREWDTCKQVLNELKQTYGDKLIYDIYLERMSSTSVFLLTEDWNGVFEHTSK